MLFLANGPLYPPLIGCLLRLVQFEIKLLTLLQSSAMTQIINSFAAKGHFILFYFVLFYFILFYFILFYFILFYFILFYFSTFIAHYPRVSSERFTFTLTLLAMLPG
jgi:hypothetical protein